MMAELTQPCALGYSGWFGVVSSGDQVAFGVGCRVVVQVGVSDRGDRTPEQVVVLGVHARDAGVRADHVAHRK